MSKLNLKQIYQDLGAENRKPFSFTGKTKLQKLLEKMYAILTLWYPVSGSSRSALDNVFNKWFSKYLFQVEKVSTCVFTVGNYRRIIKSIKTIQNSILNLMSG